LLRGRLAHRGKGFGLRATRDLDGPCENEGIDRVLTTVILDTYEASEAATIASALDDLCSPKDNYGWASEGVYCFFDPAARCPLYLGLAEDLAIRFKQHNGLLTCPDNSCKRERIGAHFAEHKTIGFGIFVQSCLDQSTVRRNREGRLSLWDGSGRRNAAYTEGRMIEAHRLAFGALPVWNEVGGAIAGKAHAVEADVAIVKALSGDTDSDLVARRSLRQLSKEPSAVVCESNLHAARVFMMGPLGTGTTLEDGLALLTKHGAEDCSVPPEYLANRLKL
jgi:hypothetical protein